MFHSIFCFAYAPTLAISAAIFAVGSYLLGSVNFSIILSKIFLKKDIREMGSGNAGATNMLRSAGKTAGVLTLLLDAAKCVAAVLPARFFYLAYSPGIDGGPGPELCLWAQWGAYLAGFCCMMGHIFPVYFKFKGGKGVVTMATTAALVDWRVFLICLGVFMIVFAASRMVSLSSILGAAAYPVATFCMTFFLDCRPWVIFEEDYIPHVLISTTITCIGAVVIIVKHRSNIKRILNGTEKKISFKKSKTTA